MIKDIFQGDEADIICQLPLSKYRQQDVLIWRGTSNGEFFVQSAYNMKKERKYMQRGDGSQPSGFGKLWKPI